MSSAGDEDNGWWRSADGRVIHRSSCRYRRLPWHWAAGKTLDGLNHLAPTYGWFFGKCCIQDPDMIISNN